MKAMFKKIYALTALLILLISMVFIVQYLYMNNKVIKNKEVNIERSSEVLGQKITSELKLSSQVIESIATIIISNNWSKEEIEYNLNKMFNTHSVFSLLYYADSDNNLITATDWEAPEDFDIKSRPWYTKALAQGGLVYSETFVDVRTGGLAIAIAKPIYNSDNNLRGVVAGDISITEIIKLVESSSASVKNISYSFLIDSKGNILAHPNYTYEDYTHLKTIDEVSHLLSQEIRKSGYGKKQLIIDDVEGYLSYQPIKNTDWTIGSFASLEEYKGRDKYLFTILGVTFLAALAILGLFLMIQNKYFVKPLRLLGEDIENVTYQDDISYRVPLNEKDSFLEPRKSVNNILEKAEMFFRQQQEYSEELMASHEELEAQNVQLYHLSNYDQLTNLHNRRFFEKQLAIMDVEENLPLGIIMADVNGLKLINDSFGHEAGDRLLKETGKSLRQVCHDKELVFRIGGDEFVIILPKTNPSETRKIIKEIANISKKVDLDHVKLSISFGMGIKNEASQDIADILKIAEDDMYSNKLVEGPSMRSKTIDTIVHTLHEKNARERAHSTRVSTICKEMGIELGMSEHKIKQLETVGLLHDIGKIGVPNTILEKPGALAPEEWTEIAKHPEVGYRILSTTSEMSQIAEYVLSHHERYDGKGYPQGLKGEEIPLVSRIITVADAYDAMVSDRPYRRGLPEEIAVEEIIKNAGTQFDPDLAKIFVEKILKKEWKQTSN